MSINGLGDDFIDDWFGLEHNAKVIRNGRAVEVSNASAYWNYLTLGMMKAPSEVSMRGAYSQDRGVDVGIEVKWQNDPGPSSSKERGNSQEKERTENEKESSRESKPCDE